MTGSSPPDRYKSVWLIFFILGLGTLLPWNFFMTATQYFTERLKEDASVDRFNNLNVTGKGTVFPTQTASVFDNASHLNHANANATGKTEVPSSHLAAIFNNMMTLCAMLPLLIFTCLNSFIHQRIPQQVRILCSLVAIFLVFMLTAILVKVPMEPLTFFIITMVKIVFINSGSKLEDSAFGYFITACVVILMAIGSYILLPRLDFFRYYSMKDKTEYRVHEKHSEMETKVDLIKKADELNGVEVKDTVNGASHAPQPNSSVLSIFKKIWVMAASVCFVFTVTIGVFPAVTVDTASTVAPQTLWDTKYFIPVSCFLMFNIFDWAGRSLTALCMWPGKDSRLLPFMVIARVVFIPLFMLCNVQPRKNLPVIFGHDAWYIIFMIFFAFSNGYLASLCMCFGPKKVLSHEAETAGTIMAFFLSLGLALGAIFSFLFRYVV